MVKQYQEQLALLIFQNKNLMKIITEIKDAKIEDGGSGAFYIYLKKLK